MQGKLAGVGHEAEIAFELEDEVVREGLVELDYGAARAAPGVLACPLGTQPVVGSPVPEALTSRHSEPEKQVQGPVDRGEADLRVLLRYEVVYLLGGEQALATFELPYDNPALVGQAETAGL